jgi:Zn-dependent protease
VDFDNILFQISVWSIPVLIAVTFHEAAHGWVASRLGDDTAKMLGRVTFNPIKHIDLFGTIILPVMLLFVSGGRMMFGFAKPVPVNFNRLNHPRRDIVLVALRISYWLLWRQPCFTPYRYCQGMSQPGFFTTCVMPCG